MTQPKIKGYRKGEDRKNELVAMIQSTIGGIGANFLPTGG